MMQFNNNTQLLKTIPLSRVWKRLNSTVILSLFVILLLGAMAFVVAAAPQPLKAPLSSDAGEQNASDIPSLAPNSTSPAYASNPSNTTEPVLCTTYYFHDQFKNVGSAGNQRIADATAPSAGSSTEQVEVTLPLLAGLETHTEIARFYSDPILGADFVLVGDIVGSVWLQTTDFGNTRFTGEVFDYNPANGNTTLLGNNGFQVITDGQDETIFIVTSPEVTISAGHRFLFVLYGSSPILTAPTVTLFYNSVNRDTRFDLCQIAPPKLAITKNAPMAAVAGHPITYTLTISNSGGLTATNLIISDTIPTNATYISGGTQAGNVVTWPVASLAANSAIETAFMVTATETITNAGYQVVADSNIFAVGQNDVVTVVSQPGQPNLTINKSGPAIAGPGELITYTLTVANGGDTPATGLIISDTIPAGATYVIGGIKSGDAVTWSALSLEAEASLEFNFAVTATRSITNDTYRVMADGDNMALGSKSVTTTVVAEPQATYLPILLRAGPLTTLIIQSENTGGINPVRILDPGSNNHEVLSCPIGNNVVQFCGTFPSIGVYKIVAHTVNCGILQGTFDDAIPGATVTRRIYCN
jgi:uncharacterized repeat protein (TIGR01451 family)